MCLLFGSLGEAGEVLVYAKGTKIVVQGNDYLRAMSAYSVRKKTVMRPG